jgi:hypothetical protein
MKHIPTYNELTGTQKEVCDLCLDNQKACDSNTELCIAFWKEKSWDYIENDCPCQPDETHIFMAIRKYPPESLTKYRRNLVEWKLIFPSEESKKHSREVELKNHKSSYLRESENRINRETKGLDIFIHPITHL